MRVEIRDAEWRIDRVDVPTHGGMLLTCTGQSELVRGLTASFLTELENNTRILHPEKTELVDDLSGGYMATQLYIDTVLSNTRQVMSASTSAIKPLWTCCHTS